MNIIIPIAGSVNVEGSEYMFPKPLIDVDGKPLIQYVVENLKRINGVRRFIFILREPLCTRYNLDYTLSLLTESPHIVKLKKETKGATCSVLMAYDRIDQNDEVIVVNSDQVFVSDINEAVESFRKEKSSGGVVTFDSVHPRWSFALTDEKSNVLQTAEKKPISRNAIAGFYYFKTFGDFVQGAFDSVYNEEFVNDQLYISSVLNQMILQNKKVTSYHIRNEDYISFYSPQRIKEFERLVIDKKIII